jgi:hypothetical protein
MFGSFLPSLWSLSNHSLLGSRSRHCYAIIKCLPRRISRLERMPATRNSFAILSAVNHSPILLGTSSFTASGWNGSFYPPGMKPSDYLWFYAERFHADVAFRHEHFHRPVPCRVPLCGVPLLSEARIIPASTTGARRARGEPDVPCKVLRVKARSRKLSH